MPAWSVGTRSKGNEGVTASVQTTPGSIGYVEYGCAMIQKMPMAQLRSRRTKKCGGDQVNNNDRPREAAADKALSTKEQLGDYYEIRTRRIEVQAIPARTCPSRRGG
jgi:ABC-type phosphate transport system substrate-binding protein